jgi:hypothetical protein
MIVDAESRTDSDLPTFAPAQFHSVVWSGASAHWTTHQYRVAVREAAEGLTVHWKERLGRNDVDDTVFWQQTLSPGAPEPGKPKLTWPGALDDKTVKSMRGGLEPLAKALNLLATGLNLTVRNVTTPPTVISRDCSIGASPQAPTKTSRASKHSPSATDSTRL